MAKALGEKHGAQTEIVKTVRNAFEVYVDGELVWSGLDKVKEEQRRGQFRDS